MRPRFPGVFGAVVALLLLLGPVLPSAGQAGDATGREVLELLSRLRVDEAERRLADVPEQDDARGMAAALVHFHRGRYQEARDALASASGTPADLAASMAWLPDRITGAQAATRGMEEVAIGNFVYRYAPGHDAVLVEYASEALEAEREAMLQLMGVAPSQPTVVEFFPDVQALVLASGLPLEWVETTGTVAISKWDRLLVLSPMNMSRGYPWMDTLAHEYVHLALARASANNAPVWFQEGSAKVLESAWRDGDRRRFLSPYSESLLAKALGEDSLIPFASMHPSMAALPSSDAAGLAFAQVACAVDYLLEEAGDEGYRRIVEQTALHGDVFRAIDLVLGRGGRFESRYRRHMRGLDLEIRSDVFGFEPKIAAGAGAEEDDAVERLDPVLLAHRRMRDLTRIGDLLRLRGRLEAALLEYQEAGRTGPYHSPALANKQARALLGLGRAPEARELLSESVKLYPEYTPTITLLADLALRDGDHRLAVELGNRSLHLNPFDPKVHLRLAEAYEALDDAEGADREIRAIGLLVPQQPGDR